MSDLDELYQSLILDHNKTPRNFHRMEDATAHAEGRNPLCGDQFEIWLRLDGEVIADVSFLGQGCAISKASASMMTQAIKGKTVAVNFAPLSWHAMKEALKAVRRET